MKKFLISTLFAAAISSTTTTQAAPITFTGTLGNLSSSATFNVIGNNLFITLSNIGGDVLNPADLLTALFFTIQGDPTLTPVSAIINNGSTVVFDAQGQPVGGIVGGEWSYVDGLSGAPSGADEGISSSGFNLFGQATFPGLDLDSPTAVNGINYAITSQNDNLATGNNQVTGGEPLIRYSVVFQLSGISPSFDPSAAGAINNLSFQYGTSLNEPNIPVTPPTRVPEPATVALLGLGLAGLGLVRRRRAKER